MRAAGGHAAHAAALRERGPDRDPGAPAAGRRSRRRSRARARGAGIAAAARSEPGRAAADRRRARGARQPPGTAHPAARAARPREPARAAGVRRGGRARRGARAPAGRPRGRDARAREADRRHRPPDPRDVRADLRGGGAQLRAARRPAVPRRAAAACGSWPSATGPARVLGGATPPSDDDEDGSDEAVENDPAAEEDLLGVEIEITPGRQGHEAADAAVGRREVDDRAGVPVCRVPGAPLPVLHPRRGRGRARRPEHRPLPGAACGSTPRTRSSSS